MSSCFVFKVFNRNMSQNANCVCQCRLRLFHLLLAYDASVQVVSFVPILSMPPYGPALGTLIRPIGRSTPIGFNKRTPIGGNTITIHSPMGVSIRATIPIDKPKTTDSEHTPAIPIDKPKTTDSEHTSIDPDLLQARWCSFSHWQLDQEFHNSGVYLKEAHLYIVEELD